MYNYFRNLYFIISNLKLKYKSKILLQLCSCLHNGIEWKFKLIFLNCLKWTHIHIQKVSNSYYNIYKLGLNGSFIVMENNKFHIDCFSNSFYCSLLNSMKWVVRLFSNWNLFCDNVFTVFLIINSIIKIIESSFIS